MREELDYIIEICDNRLERVGQDRRIFIPYQEIIMRDVLKAIRVLAEYQRDEQPEPPKGYTVTAVGPAAVAQLRDMLRLIESGELVMRSFVDHSGPFEAPGYVLPAGHHDVTIKYKERDA